MHVNGKRGIDVNTSVRHRLPRTYHRALLVQADDDQQGTRGGTSGVQVKAGSAAGGAAKAGAAARTRASAKPTIRPRSAGVGRICPNRINAPP